MSARWRRRAAQSNDDRDEIDVDFEQIEITGHFAQFLTLASNLLRDVRLGDNLEVKGQVDLFPTTQSGVTVTQHEVEADEVTILTGPKDGEAYVRDWMTIWSQLQWLPLRERATGRALEVQSELALAAPGAHRHSVSHFLIAACAEDAGPEVVLWHWDPDLAAICEHTGQPHELVTLPAQIAASRRSHGNGGARPALIRPPGHAEGA